MVATTDEITSENEDAGRKEGKDARRFMSSVGFCASDSKLGYVPLRRRRTVAHNGGTQAK